MDVHNIYNLGLFVQSHNTSKRNLEIEKSRSEDGKMFKIMKEENLE